MTDHQFLFGFVFSPFLLWKMWTKVYSREWGLERLSRVTVNTPNLFCLNNRSITYLYMRGVYIFQRPISIFSIAFTQNVRDDSYAWNCFLSVLHCNICLMVFMALKAVEIVLFPLNPNIEYKLGNILKCYTVCQAITGLSTVIIKQQWINNFG